MEHQSLTKDQQEKWEEKKLRAAERVEKLNAELNENLAGRIMAAFQDGVDMHCPHGLPVAQEDGKKFPHYDTGLNAVLLATEMKEQKFYYPTFVDSRSIDAMQKDSHDVFRKKGTQGIRIHSAVRNKEGETLLDTRTVYNIYQLRGKDVPKEEYCNSTREDFTFEKTVEYTMERIQEAQKSSQPIDIVAICYDARKDAFEDRKERDGMRKERLDAIKTADLSRRPRNLSEALRQACRKSIEAHRGEYHTFVRDGVKSVLLEHPQTKWSNMAEAIHEVAPLASYDGGNRVYADSIKELLQSDRKFKEDWRDAHVKAQYDAREGR